MTLKKYEQTKCEFLGPAIELAREHGATRYAKHIVETRDAYGYNRNRETISVSFFDDTPADKDGCLKEIATWHPIMGSFTATGRRFAQAYIGHQYAGFFPVPEAL